MRSAASRPAPWDEFICVPGIPQYSFSRKPKRLLCESRRLRLAAKRVEQVERD